MMKVLFFGQLTDITGASSVELPESADTDALMEALVKKYPALSSTKFVVAVNKKQINENTPLSSQSNIVLMPPFSGG
jgi:molybdopterin synthase sulfur carrier subunit